jgi:hypothetical protein
MVDFFSTPYIPRQRETDSRGKKRRRTIMKNDPDTQ